MPLAFDAVVARALAKDPADRYASAGDLGRAALAAATGAPAATARGSVARGEATPERATPTAITSLADAAGVTAIAPTSLAAGAEATRATTPAGPAPGANGDRPPRRRARPQRRGDGARAHAPRPPPAPRGDADMARAPPAGRRRHRLRHAPRHRDPTGPLSTGEVTGIADSFADAYTHEDEVSLRRLLTPEARRVGTSDSQNGRASVVGEYHRQFVAADVVSYRLADMQVTAGRVGRAEGHYTVIRRGRGPLTGRLVLGVIRWRGEPRIDLIATEPRGSAAAPGAAAQQLRAEQRITTMALTLVVDVVGGVE